MSAPFNEFGPFAVGEVCRIVYAKSFPELIGAEVMIIAGPCVLRDSDDGSEWVGYITDLKYKGYRISPQESFLRRRKPPQADSNERTYMQMWRDMAGKAPQRVGVPA